MNKIISMNHSQRYQDELEGRAAPMTAADRHNSLLDAIQGAVNMARWAYAKGNMDKFWTAIHAAYKFDAQLVALLNDQAEDTRGLMLGL